MSTELIENTLVIEEIDPDKMSEPSEEKLIPHTASLETSEKLNEVSEEEEGVEEGEIDTYEGTEKSVQTDKDKKKELDDDQDRRNPQYIPKAGAFYEHDNRTLDEDEVATVEASEKKKVWKESKAEERWLHDCYNEDEQRPKTKEELVDSYGYDIRNEEAPPRARRRRKYGRGPDKYERKWEDEQAYQPGNNQRQPVFKKGRKKPEEFPALSPQDEEVKNEKNTAGPWRGPSKNTQSFKSNNPKHEQLKTEPRPNYMNNNNNNINNSTSNHHHHHHHSNAPGFHSGGKLDDRHIKPFRNDSNSRSKPKNSSDTVNIQSPKFTKVPNIEERPTPVVANEKNVQGITQQLQQMNVNKSYIRSKNASKPTPDSASIQEAEARVNPKRYSVLRKGYNPCFPPSDMMEISPEELELAQQRLAVRQQQQAQAQAARLVQQQQDLELAAAVAMQSQSVIQRFPPPTAAATAAAAPPDGYSTTGHLPPANQQQQQQAAAAYLASRAMLHQAAAAGLSPQGGLGPPPQMAPLPRTIDMAAAAAAAAAANLQPANFVPHQPHQPLFIDMETHAHYAQAAAAAQQPPPQAFAAYPPPNQNTELYQASSGITYYSPEVQNTAGGLRALPVRRPKAAIPILPPPETQ